MENKNGKIDAKTQSLCTGTKSNLGGEFWMKKKRIALLLCQAKGDIVDSMALKLCVLTNGDFIRSFMALFQG